jgi:hypothetical protein
MNPMPPPTPAEPVRSRLTLLLIAVLFLGSFFIAAALRFSGWQPAAIATTASCCSRR